MQTDTNKYTDRKKQYVFVKYFRHTKTAAVACKYKISFHFNSLSLTPPYLHLSLSLSIYLSIFSCLMFINSVVQRNSAVFHLELRSSDVCIIIVYAMYAQPTPLTKTTTTTIERQRRLQWCGLVCERVTARVNKRQRRQQSATRLTSSTRLVRRARMLRAHGHTLIIITLGTRETKLVYPGPRALPDCDVAAHATIDTTRLRYETHVRAQQI